MPKIYSHHVIVYAPDNQDVIEHGEIIHSSVIAHTQPIVDWFNEDFETDTLLRFLDSFKKPGVYSIISTWSHWGGKDADTPNGPGEYWSELKLLDAISTRLRPEEVEPYIDDPFDEQQSAILFGDLCIKPLFKPA